MSGLTPPIVALLTLGDGRDELLDQTLASFHEHAVNLTIAHHVHVDDRSHRFGFSGAIQEGWERLRARAGFDYVWHLEEDFTTLRTVDVAAMARVLELRSDLAQVALRRNAVAPAEIAAGGLVELWPDEYRQMVVTYEEPVRLAWLEHSLCFTTNPCLYRRSLLAHHWPDAPGSEAAFTARMRSAGFRFALWGDREDGAWVEHTGHLRTGTGY